MRFDGVLDVGHRRLIVHDAGGEVIDFTLEGMV
jgi:hypothetical protein